MPVAPFAALARKCNISVIESLADTLLLFNGVEVPVMFAEVSEQDLPPALGGRTKLTELRAECMAEAFEGAPVAGDTVQIEGREYAVSNARTHPDGWLTLALRRTGA